MHGNKIIRYVRRAGEKERRGGGERKGEGDVEEERVRKRRRAEGRAGKA